MSELGGGQAGGFSSPYNPNIRANNSNKQAIRKTAPEQQAETNQATEAPAKPVTKEEIANEVLQRRADSQRIHKEVAENRTAQADSYTSREETGNARADRVSRFADHPFIKEQEQQQARERLARNINQAALGLERLTGPDSPEDIADPQLASHAAQANENLDPDAKARKKFGEKLSKILLDNKGEEFLSFLGVKKTNSGRISEKDIKEFIESGEGLEALNDTTIQELVDGYYENVLKETTRLTPSDMLGGDHATRFYMDKIDASNTEELWQFQTKYAEQPDAPLSIKSDRLIVQAQKDKNRVRVKPQAFHKSEIAKTTVEQVIEMTSAMPGTYWAADALQGAV